LLQKPKLILVNGKPQIHSAPALTFQQQREQALALAQENRELAVVNDHKLSSLSFMKRQPAEKWRPEET